jgi:hypothetical protein
MTDTKIYLCGTHHFDMNGPRRLRKVFETLRPDNVAVETYSGFLDEGISRHDQVINLADEKVIEKLACKFKLEPKELNPETALRFARAVGYEVWVPGQYVKKTGAKILCLEDEQVVQSAVRDVKNQHGEEIELFLGELLKRPLETFLRFSDMAYGFDGDLNELARAEERNQIWADKLRTLQGRTLAVVGFGHLYDGKKTLRDLLREYEPIDFKLIQADGFDNATEELRLEKEFLI